jgi:SnoaL-like polyketide cyclase
MCSAQGGHTTSVEANNAIALRDWEAWNTGNLAIIDDDFCHRRFPCCRRRVGRGRERPSYRTALPDLHVLLEPVFAGKDTVTVRWTAHEAHRGNSELVWHHLGGVRKASQQLPPTGKLVTWSDIDSYHLTETKSWEAGAAWIG